ncbi:NlpC/P60 family protein [Pseudobacillus sp. FSL P4-0506]|uniref:C40 family peptidase n=1 Tax=unclassified Pseudobacillus TaxID=2619284 RepID=UPI0030FCC645
MKKLQQAVIKALQKKLVLWIIGLFGTSGIAITVVFAILVLAILGAVVGSSNNSSSPDGFSSSCSITGEIDLAKFQSTLAGAGKLKGTENTIIKIAKEQGIDPVLFAAIALHETGFGTSNAIKNKNNPGGLMDPKTGSKRLYVFATLEEGLAAMGRTLHNRIIKDGLNTIEKLGSVYAPLGAANDPNNLNSHWVPRVTEYAAQLGGLTMNCEVTEGLEGLPLDPNVGGATFKAMKAEFEKYNGWKYTWGGASPKTSFDCSGLTQYIYKAILGVNIPRTAAAQYSAAKKIPASEAKPGDLVFYKNTYKQGISHVGIYVGNGMMFNAQSKKKGIRYNPVKDNYFNDSRFAGFGRFASID